MAYLRFSTLLARAALLLVGVACVLSGSACGGGDPEETGFLLRVLSTFASTSEVAEMEASITCGEAATVTRIDLHPAQSDEGLLVWEGPLDPPSDDCTLTLELACAGELACISHGSITADSFEHVEDNVLEVVPVCSLPIPSPLAPCFSAE